MKEIGILFSERPMRALMAGRKTQTRRIVKLPPDAGDVVIDPGGTIFGPGPYIKVYKNGGAQGDAPMHPRIRCPYGYPGDRLWVRETFAIMATLPQEYLYGKIGTLGIRKYGGGAPERPGDLRYRGGDALVQYRCNPRSPAELERSPGFDTWSPTQPERWRPGIFMPRWASRMTLEVTEVRVERLQDISEGDAIAEGVTTGLIPADDYGPVRVGYVLGVDDGKCTLYPTAREAFRVGWGQINGEESWDENPWLWCVSLKRVDAQARAA
jgi:hypothetical protein